MFKFLYTVHSSLCKHLNRNIYLTAIIEMIINCIFVSNLKVYQFNIIEKENTTHFLYLCNIKN